MESDSAISWLVFYIAFGLGFGAVFGLIFRNSMTFGGFGVFGVAAGIGIGITIAEGIRRRFLSRNGYSSVQT